MESNIKISIITVCKNAENSIKQTIDSVIHQTYSNIEYIIIDGKSSDNTLKIIEEIKRNNSIMVISEDDKGIYDAMNKGLDIATGDYVEFLNSGDTLFNEKVVENVARNIQLNKADIVYGSICYNYTDGNKEIRKYGQSCSSQIYYLTGDCINHQALFTKKDCFQEDKFDLSYKICADREWMMRISKKGKIFISLDAIICNYSLDSNSMSIKNKVLSKLEANACIKKHYLWGYPIYKLFSIARNHVFLKRALHNVYKALYIRDIGENEQL